MFKLNLDLDLSQANESAEADNSIALERCDELFNQGYYLIMQPKTRKNGVAYFWITATKKGEDRKEFSVMVNQLSTNYIIHRLLGVDYIKVSKEEANDLDSFNEQVSNFELALYQAERAQGKTMKRTYTQRTQILSSYYKNGVIVYKPHLNPELQKHINA